MVRLEKQLKSNLVKTAKKLCIPSKGLKKKQLIRKIRNKRNKYKRNKIGGDRYTPSAPRWSPSMYYPRPSAPSAPRWSPPRATVVRAPIFKRGAPPPPPKKRRSKKRSKKKSKKYKRKHPPPPPKQTTYKCLKRCLKKMF
jgi:hypothetical protein